MMATLMLGLGAGAPAAALDVVSTNASGARHPDLAAVPVYTVAAHVLLPQLPEPEMVAMMLVGLVLIGYRARRDSDEKFT